MTTLNEAAEPARQRRTQFLKFLLVGLANTALSFAVFKLVLAAAPAGMLAASVAQALSYCAGICLSYLLNRGWVFTDAGKSSRVKTRFLIVQVGLALGSTAAIGLLVDGFGMHETLVWVAVMGVVTILNFLLLRTWVFKPT